MSRTLKEKVFNFLKDNIDSTKTLHEILLEQEVIEIKKDFGYRTSKGSFVFCLKNIFEENEYIKQIINKINNSLPEGTIIEVNQFQFDKSKGNVLMIVAMTTKADIDLIEQLHSVINSK